MSEAFGTTSSCYIHGRNEGISDHELGRCKDTECVEEIKMMAAGSHIWGMR